PGQNVVAGMAMGTLQGSAVKALLARHQAAVNGAQAVLTAARHRLAIAQEKRATRLSTRQEVYNAQAAGKQAKAKLAAAQAALQAAQKTVVLRAPATGPITSVAVTNGERVTAGQIVLTVQPAHSLWLKAMYHGAGNADIHAGMHGRFLPADGSTP